jgi:hypothetical protein
MELYTQDTPQSRVTREVERLEQLAADKQRELDLQKKLAEETKQEFLRREQTWRERMLAAGLSSDEAVKTLQTSYSASAERNPAHESDMLQVVRLFGPKSDGAAANKLALSNYSEYQRLRKLALAAGRVHERQVGVRG